MHLNPDLKAKLPSIKELERDVSSTKRRYYDHLGETCVKNLKKNNFAAYYVKTKEEAASLLCSLVPENATVGCGDSHTLFALDVEEKLKTEKGCAFISHGCALNVHAQNYESPDYIKMGTKEEIREVLMHYLVSDVFILGANGISMDGQIVNVDGCGNRIAGSLYGPDRIIVVAGVNKLAPDVQSARARVGFVAAPMNNLKYDWSDMPCVKAGGCVDCRHENRICNITTVIHKKPMDSDFHVIIIGEELGY